MNKAKKWLIYANASAWMFLYANPVLAESNVDALQGETSASETVNQIIEGNASNAQNAGDVVQQIKDIVPDAQPSEQLNQINDALNVGREQSTGLAVEIARPVIYVAMLGANIIWYTVTALFMWQTAVDVLALSFSGLRSLVSHQEQNQQGFSPIGWIKSFFSVSTDYEQVLQMAGMPNSAGTGNTGANNFGNQSANNFGGGFNNFGGGNNFGNNGVGMNGGNGNNKPKSSNLLGMYIRKRFWTLCWLGLTIAIFSTSLATDFQGDIVSWALALIKAGFEFVGSFF